MGAIRSNKADPATDSAGPACDWFPADSPGATISVNTFPSFGGPGNLGQPGLQWAQRTGDIAGYPAQHDSLAGQTGPQNGDCETTVVVSSQAAVAVAVSAYGMNYQYYANACAPADALVTDVISYLKSGG